MIGNIRVGAVGGLPRKFGIPSRSVSVGAVPPLTGPGPFIGVAFSFAIICPNVPNDVSSAINRVSITITAKRTARFGDDITVSLLRRRSGYRRIGERRSHPGDRRVLVLWNRKRRRAVPVSVTKVVRRIDAKVGVSTGKGPSSGADHR